MVDGECFWPEKVSVGEVVYPPVEPLAPASSAISNWSWITAGI